MRMMMLRKVENDESERAKQRPTLAEYKER